MDKESIEKLFMELLDDYERSEQAVIDEYSTNHGLSCEFLKITIEDYKEKIRELLK